MTGAKREKSRDCVIPSQSRPVSAYYCVLAYPGGEMSTMTNPSRSTNPNTSPVSPTENTAGPKSPRPWPWVVGIVTAVAFTAGLGSACTPSVTSATPPAHSTEAGLTLSEEAAADLAAWRAREAAGVPWPAADDPVKPVETTSSAYTKTPPPLLPPPPPPPPPLPPPAPNSRAASQCDPNYSGACVPIASDVDCEGGSGNGPEYVRGPVNVVGEDIYKLDGNNDGVGCES